MKLIDKYANSHYADIAIAATSSKASSANVIEQYLPYGVTAGRILKADSVMCVSSLFPHDNIH